jgi:hypothetical protein
MHHEIEIDEYLLRVEITDLTDIKADPASWASPEDFYGCRELEFRVVSGKVYDEDSKLYDLDSDQCAEAAEQHAELIEDLLWRIIDGQKEVDEIERAEARADWREA